MGSARGKHITFEKALEEYRAYSRIQHRSHAADVDCGLRTWERGLDARTLLAKISTAQIDAIKKRRANEVSKSTVDKDLAVLKAFFNWCIGRGYASKNPVRPVQLFREDNSRLLTAAVDSTVVAGENLTVGSAEAAG